MIDDKLTIEEIVRATGIDWQMAVYLRENLDQNSDLEHWGKGDSHYVELVIGSGVPGNKSAYEATLSIREFEQLVKMLNKQLKDYKQTVTTKFHDE